MQVGRMVLCDACGTKLPAVRQTLQSKIGDLYRGMDITLECFPADDVEHDPDAVTKVRSSPLRPAPVVQYTVPYCIAMRLNAVPPAPSSPHSRLWQRYTFVPCNSIRCATHTFRYRMQ